MDSATLTPIAEMLISSYFDTAVHSRKFKGDYGNPPTKMARSHHLRSIVQSLVIGSERYKLGAEYAESGRVEITDLQGERVYLLRSALAVAVDKATKDDALFNSLAYVASPTVLLVYRFQPLGLDLAVAGAKHLSGHTRLEATGPANYVDTWPYVATDPDPFDQGRQDPFTDLGEIDDLDEDEG